MPVAKIAVPAPVLELLSYEIGDLLSVCIGSRVFVPLGKREVVGIVFDIVQEQEKTTYTLKPISHVLDDQRILPKSFLTFLRKLSAYYHYPIGLVCFSAVPSLFKKNKPIPKLKLQANTPVVSLPSYDLTEEQCYVINAITQASSGFMPFLLQGVTASGKTEVYLRVIEHWLKRGFQALVLVPEINLTPQTVQRFEQRFGAGTCIAIHSVLTPKQRLVAWQRAQEHDVNIIIGTRAALFTPFKKLGGIIIDEEHDISFKQQEGFRYSARDAAVLRAQLEKIPVVLGSATPSLETLVNVINQRYTKLELNSRVGKGKKVKFQLIDLKGTAVDQGVSVPLMQQMKKTLDHGSQVLLFVNRRGYAPVLMCHQCGWHAECARCDRQMTFHQSIHQLICHHCDKQIKEPKQCPVCGRDDLIAVGVGTQRLEEYLNKCFPEVPVVRVDRDSTRRKDSFNAFVEEVHKGQPMILIGTQMLAKGHHFPKIGLVGIVDVDGGFFSSDFRSVERMGQLITQVAGRAGREMSDGVVAIQTHHPDHPLLTVLLKQGYDAFAQQLLEERKLASLPPFSYFALLRAQAKKENYPAQFLSEVKSVAPEFRTVNLLGPIPAPMPKRSGYYRSQLLITSTNRKKLHEFLDQLVPLIPKTKSSKRVKYSLDVDPADMM